MQTPVHTIASNAGVEGAVVVGKLLEQNDPDLGYDAAKGKGSWLLFADVLTSVKRYSHFIVIDSAANCFPCFVIR